MFAVFLNLFFVCSNAKKQCSSYHYEEQILEKVVRMEYRLERLEDKVNSLGKEVPEKICYECPGVWIRFKESCYLFEERKYQFLEARSHCKRLGADLVHINDLQENEFIQQNLKRLKGVDFWIGLEDTAIEGFFKWVDDSTLPAFTGWDKEQINNSGGGEDCAHFRTTYNYNWNDAPCHFTFGSICEMKVNL